VTKMVERVQYVPENLRLWRTPEEIGHIESRYALAPAKGYSGVLLSWPREAHYLVAGADRVGTLTGVEPGDRQIIDMVATALPLSDMVARALSEAPQGGPFPEVPTLLYLNMMYAVVDSAYKIDDWTEPTRPLESRGFPGAMMLARALAFCHGGAEVKLVQAKKEGYKVDVYEVTSRGQRFYRDARRRLWPSTQRMEDYGGLETLESYWAEAHKLGVLKGLFMPELVKL